MKDKINNELFLYETPMMQWIPSTVYRFDGFFDGLKIMHAQGVAGNKIYLGGDCAHCHMYGLVNVAAFLAQAMKETIRYDACDENSWDRVGTDLMYPISNACGQLGQSYQDYHCSEEERHMECEVDPQMTITAVTNAKWWGAPGPLKCGPKSMYPQTGYWDYYFNCDNIWADPPETCDAYEGQTGGKANNDAPYPNAAGRTDVEGCCWWGRGVIQTSGVCNFGKLNYFLGKRAADEGRESRYPNIDFCRDPEAICSSEEHEELKWIAGLFYWISEVQRYDNGGWNYINELHKFVDGGLEGDAFINAVSGIVNRGCHNPPCGTGALDGGPERAQNFFDIVKEMKFSFVEVVPGVSPPPTNDESPEPLAKMRPSEVRYTCGNGYQPDELDASIPPSDDVAFDYEISNGIDVTVVDALRDVKESILSDIAGRMGCYKTYSGRTLQDSSDDFGSIIGLQSNAHDLPDPDAGGCMVAVETDDPSTCTPVSGGFTIYAKPGTSESSLQYTTNSLNSIIETGMVAGLYETETVLKAVYIGDRDKFSASSSAPINAQSDGARKFNEGMHIAIYVLSCACAILICLLCFTVWTCREKEQKRRIDEEMAFSKFIIEEENEHSMYDMDYIPQSRHRQLNHNRSRNGSNESDGFGEYPNSRPRANTSGNPNERRRRESITAAASAPSAQVRYESEEEILSLSSKSSETSAEDMKPIVIQRHSPPRKKSAPRPQPKNSNRRIPQSQSISDSSESGSVSSDSSGSVSSDSNGSVSSDSSGESSKKEKCNGSAPSRSTNVSNKNVPSMRPPNDNSNSPGYIKSMESVPTNSSFAREERQKRMAEARARAARRRIT